MRRLSALLCTLLFCTACSEPPTKEMNQAHGAIEAARAAGAEQYAPEPFAAATAALEQSRDAVVQRDYRQALARALDANERAQAAAKEAADGKARARSDAERVVSGASAALQRLEARIKTAEAARIAAADLRAPRTAAKTAAAAVQEARTSLSAGSYLEASEAVRGLQEEIQAQIRALDEAPAPKPARRAPRRR